MAAAVWSLAAGEQQIGLVHFYSQPGGHAILSGGREMVGGEKNMESVLYKRTLFRLVIAFTSNCLYQ